MELLGEFVCSLNTVIASTMWFSKRAVPIHLYSHQVSTSARYPDVKRWPSHHSVCLLNSALINRLRDVGLLHIMSRGQQVSIQQVSYSGKTPAACHCFPLWSMYSFLHNFFFLSAYHWPVRASLWSRQKWGCYCHFTDEDKEAQRG